MTRRRMSAALLACLVLATLAARVRLNMAANDRTLIDALWAIFFYFTIWTNSLIGLACAILAVRGWLDRRISGGLLLAIVMVATVYHTLLAGLNDYRGMDALIDLSLHAVVPVWFALHWILFEPKAGLRLRVVPLWLVLPAVYCIYALMRAQIDGRYPYPFLDIAEKGVATVGVNILGLLLAFGLGAALIVGAARVLPRGS